MQRIKYVYDIHYAMKLEAIQIYYNRHTWGKVLSHFFLFCLAHQLYSK